MENLKIRVANEAESKEVHDLAKKIGCDKPYNNFTLRIGYVCLDLKSMQILDVSMYQAGDELNEYRELTIPQLKDLVVLKRNDVRDRTHTDESGCDYYQGSHGEFYYKTISNWKRTREIPEFIKTIEKTMKEYLDPRSGYKLIEAPESEALEPHASEWIEIPEGATAARLCEDVEFYKNDFGMFLSLISGNWTNSISLKSVLMKNIVWQRQAQPEELPINGFEDVDAFIESNVEQGVKHSHYKKDISHLDTLDIYRVTELFKPHSCGAHIAKKALCSGQRGHKDLLTDIQDIIDTAERWKEMLIEDSK